MKYLIITGNPKEDGLCCTITEEVRNGAEASGATVDILNIGNLARCHDKWAEE